ncbi:MAG: imidazoleglycerol-phosphate dehydratase HisB [Clostridia bacterium]|nr:imidazoleglycerol-phosphate dehydratase HisB [Clostridia bacterium]
MRSAVIKRKTKETDIELSLKILEYGKKGCFTGTSGIGFFDHMLTSFASHGGFEINLKCAGDLNVDGHHTVEDVGIVLGMALKEAAGDMKGIKRFSDILMPMDEALVMCALDYSGRAFLFFDSTFTSPMIGDYDTQLTVEFMRALSTNAAITLHLKALYGANDHHITEALYKAAGKCIGDALRVISDEVMSTKGVL